MTCKDAKPMREQILAIAGTPRELFIHRFSRCCHATDCGRLCERLVKGPGKDSVQCWSNYPASPADMRHLYESLQERTFACPAGLF
ncbi:MAG: hypothetical protein PHU85_10415 [Phycisphaerae bacterium]|nr:hypothetical protein [Phycisphaerae bacterium]